jgi:hypothetical protein
LVLASTDVGKVALQTDTDTFYVLLDDVAPSWLGLTLSATTISDLQTQVEQVIPVACSNETTALALATGVVIFHAPFDFTLLKVWAGLSVAQAAGSIFTVDINKNAVTVLSTKITIDNTEATSLTAVAPPVISVSSFTEGDRITIDIDQVGTPLAAGLKVYFIVRRTP